MHCLMVYIQNEPVNIGWFGTLAKDTAMTVKRELELLHISVGKHPCRHTYASSFLARSSNGVWN